jgi:hypothetical protein
MILNKVPLTVAPFLFKKKPEHSLNADEEKPRRSAQHAFG